MQKLDKNIFKNINISIYFLYANRIHLKIFLFSLKWSKVSGLGIRIHPTIPCKPHRVGPHVTAPRRAAADSSAPAPCTQRPRHFIHSG